MEPDTLRKMIAAGPVEVTLNNGDAYTLRSGETIVSDFEIVTLWRDDRGLHNKYVPLNTLATATPVRSGG